jgi:hypothetical protein
MEEPSSVRADLEVRKCTRLTSQGFDLWKVRKFEQCF